MQPETERTENLRSSERLHASEGIRGDDGSRLEVKEGELLDRNDNPIPMYSEDMLRTGSSVHVWRMGGILAPLFLAGFIIFLSVAGFTILGGVVAFLLATWVLRLFVRLVFSLFSSR